MAHGDTSSDQFEEYSLYHPEDDLFARQFPQAIVPGDRSVSFLVSLREDSLARLDRFKGRIPTLWDSYRRIDHLDRAAAEDAIRRPLREYNRRLSPGQPEVTIEDSLVAAVLEDVQADNVELESGGIESAGGGTLGKAKQSGGRIETPYLQLVMTHLWEREQEKASQTLRLTTYEREGGAHTIVRTHLDRVMRQLTPEEQDIAAKVFHRLVTPSGAKIALNVKDLAKYEDLDEGQLAPILQRLEGGNRRILRRVASRAEGDAEPRYEIFHDRLGKAILAWRTKRLSEEERNLHQRQEAEQKRVAEESQASVRGHVDEVMNSLSAQEIELWASMLFLLVSVQGRRFARTIGELSTYARRPEAFVERLVHRLMNAGVLRTKRIGPHPVPHYKIIGDVMAMALLEWHSRYMSAQHLAAPSPEVAPPLPREDRFPYSQVSDKLRRGKVVPFLGAGVNLSARAPGRPSAPSTSELKEQLARACDFPPAELDRSDLAEVASYFTQYQGRAVLDDHMHRSFSLASLTPSATHHCLAAIAASSPLLICTTNYDNLMERALDEARVAYDVVAYLHGELAYLRAGRSEVEFAKAYKLESDEQRTLVLRLYGPIYARGGRVGGYVLTEEDHLDWVSQWGDGVLLHTALAQPQLKSEYVLSLGQSANHWSQRALLRLLAERSRWGSWAVALNPSPMSVMAWQHYRMKVHNLPPEPQFRGSGWWPPPSPSLPAPMSVIASGRGATIPGGQSRQSPWPVEGTLGRTPQTGTAPRPIHLRAGGRQQPLRA